MKKFREFINEMFEFNSELKRNPQIEKQIKSMLNPNDVSEIEVHTLHHKNIPNHFLRFKHKGAYEVHFGQFDNPFNEKLNIHKGSGASKLFGGVIKLYKEKIDNNEPIRYYGGNDDSNKFYDNILKKVSKGKKLYYRDVNNFVSPQGGVFDRAREISPVKLDNFQELE